MKIYRWLLNFGLLSGLLIFARFNLLEAAHLTISWDTKASEEEFGGAISIAMQNPAIKELQRTMSRAAFACISCLLKTGEATGIAAGEIGRTTALCDKHRSAFYDQLAILRPAIIRQEFQAAQARRRHGCK